jgi:hypothetical protein
VWRLALTAAALAALLSARPPDCDLAALVLAPKEAPRRGQSEALEAGEESGLQVESRTPSRRSQFSSVSRGKAGLSPVDHPSAKSDSEE